MRKAWRTARRNLIGVLACATLGTPLWAGTVLTFDVASHTEATKGAKQTKGQPLPADKTYHLTVTLSGDTLLVDEPEGVTRYDFKSTRIVRLDKGKKTYEESSLYTFIGFNVEEFINRIRVGRVLAAGAVKDNPMAPALTENLMSLADPDPAHAVVIDQVTENDETIYSWKGQRLMSVSQQTRELPPAVIRQYMRFLRYSTGGHPQILAAIERGGGVPERLTVVRSNMSVETRTLTLRSIDERPDSPLSLDGYTREILEGEPFTALRRLSTSSPADLEAHAIVLRQERDTALADGHIFDAVLANMVAMLSTGDQNDATAWAAAHRDVISVDANVQSLGRSLEPKDAASAKLAATTLAKLKQSAGPHAYVINTWESNVSLGLGEWGKAVDQMLTALAADPFITGAWIDLGNYYYGAYRADAAWACWDEARALRPTHYMLKVVDDIERKLRTDHPEFF